MGSPSSELVLNIVLFSLSSSSLLLTNKLLLAALPLPSLVAVCQFGATAAWVLLLQVLGYAEPESLVWSRVRQYLLYVTFFVSAIFFNMQALSESTVETLIVCRACCPLFVSVLEWLLAGRELPSPRSTLLLCALIVGATGYVKTDRTFELQGLSAYRWVFAYYVMICLSDTWGKRMSHLQWRSLWGPVLFTNALSVPPMMVAVSATLSVEQVRIGGWTLGTSLLLLLTCAQSVAISYFGWRCRGMVSATGYTVIGVANKMLTVLGNALVWDQRASPMGIACLLSCLLSASLYRQAPLRKGYEKRS